MFCTREKGRARERRPGRGTGFVCVVAFCLGLEFFAPEAALASPWRMMDGETLRWQGIHRQETSRSCGPAAVATLLTYFLAIPVSEWEVAPWALGWGDTPVPRAALEAPATMRGLREALARWGVPAYGMRMSVAGLQAYLDEQQLPVLVRITFPEPHFTLVAARVGDTFLLADSALGWHTLPEGELEAVWDGIALVVDRRVSADPQLSWETPSPPGENGAGSVPSRTPAPSRTGAKELAGRLEHLRRGMIP